MPETPTFSVGDVVRLKSGGPKMTVTGVDQFPPTQVIRVHVIWASASGLQMNYISPEFLQRVKEAPDAP